MTSPSAFLLQRAFPETVDVERASISQDAEGFPEETWSVLLADVSAQFSAYSPGAGPASELGGVAAVAREMRCILSGDHDVSEGDRVNRSGTAYDIIGVERDSFEIVTTLRVVEREP